jgi:hypothetical protein
MKKEQTELKKCLLSLNAVSLVFQSAIQKYKDYNIWNCIFLVVLYGCETWSHWEEGHRLKEFENGGAEEGIWI